MRPFPWWDSADVALSHTFGHATDTSVARDALAVVLGLRLGMRQGLALGLGRERRNDATLHQGTGFALVGKVLLDDPGIYPKRGVVVETGRQGIRGSLTGGPIAAIGKSGDRGGQAEHGNRHEENMFHRLFPDCIRLRRRECLEGPFDMGSLPGFQLSKSKAHVALRSKTPQKWDSRRIDKCEWRLFHLSDFG
jgi:hypothetical protein